MANSPSVEQLELEARQAGDLPVSSSTLDPTLSTVMPDGSSTTEVFNNLTTIKPDDLEEDSGNSTGGLFGLNSTQTLVVIIIVVFLVLLIFLLIYYFIIKGMRHKKPSSGRLTHKSHSGSMSEEKQRNIFAHPDKQLAVDQSTRQSQNSPTPSPTATVAAGGTASAPATIQTSATTTPDGSPVAVVVAGSQQQASPASTASAASTPTSGAPKSNQHVQGPIPFPGGAQTSTEPVPSVGQDQTGLRPPASGSQQAPNDSSSPLRQQPRSAGMPLFVHKSNPKHHNRDGPALKSSGFQTMSQASTVRSPMVTADAPAGPLSASPSGSSNGAGRSSASSNHRKSISTKKKARRDHSGKRTGSAASNTDDDTGSHTMLGTLAGLRDTLRESK